MFWNLFGLNSVIYMLRENNDKSMAHSTYYNIGI